MSELPYRTIMHGPGALTCFYASLDSLVSRSDFLSYTQKGPNAFPIISFGAEDRQESSVVLHRRSADRVTTFEAGKGSTTSARLKDTQLPYALNELVNLINASNQEGLDSVEMRFSMNSSAPNKLLATSYGGYTVFETDSEKIDGIVKQSVYDRLPNERIARTNKREVTGSGSKHHMLLAMAVINMIKSYRWIIQNANNSALRN